MRREKRKNATQEQSRKMLVLICEEKKGKRETMQLFLSIHPSRKKRIKCRPRLAATTDMKSHHKAYSPCPTSLQTGPW